MKVIERKTGGFPVREMRQFLSRLRAAEGEALGTVVCREACETLGFAKAMFSVVSGALWTPEQVYIPPELEGGFAELRRAVDGTPVPLLRAPREADLVRYRRPYILGRRSYHREAYRPLIDLSDPVAYAAAPIIANGRTVAILHVDRNCDVVTDEDLRLLSLATRVSGLVIATEENLRNLGRQRSAVTNLVEQLVDADPAGTTMFRRGRAERPVAEDTAALAATTPLTDREEEVLRLVAAGATNRQIAGRLFISDGTVKTHMRQIFRKLAVESRAQAAAHYRHSRSGATTRQ